MTEQKFHIPALILSAVGCVLAFFMLPVEAIAAGGARAGALNDEAEQPPREALGGAWHHRADWGTLHAWLDDLRRHTRHCGL